ncbi:MAG: endonuclease V, partial [Promethearchaeota archaeon]
MKHELLQDSWTLKEAERLQDKYYLISQKQQQKKVNFPTLKEIKSVVGVDISYFKKIDEEWGVSCAIFWDFEKNMMKEYSLAEDIIRFPYKPGYLGFR